MRVTKEVAATLLASPAAVSGRPAPGPFAGLTNLLVCGDWTQTSLPSTLEGAAESADRMIAAWRCNVCSNLREVQISETAASYQPRTTTSSRIRG